MDKGVLKRALDREKQRRKKAERMLEDKSRELYLSYETLKISNDELEFALSEVKNQQDKLIQSEKMVSLGLLSAGIAHEINNPLGYIFSNVATLSDMVEDFSTFHEHVTQLVGASTELDREAAMEKLLQFSHGAEIEYLFNDSRELIDDAIEGIQRVKAIVSGLQVLARTDAITKEAVDIHQCIDSTLKLVNNQIKFNTDIKRRYGKLPRIEAFPGKLGQVFLNLFTNAGHAMAGTAGTLTISTSATDDSVIITIEDTGAGMDSDTMKNIFTPFYTTKASGKGTGLGLSISQKIINEHHGSISVSSEPGVGTVFTLELPISEPIPKAA